MKEIQVGLLGLGTVGSGVVRIITDHQERLIHQVGCPVKVTKVLVQNIEKERGRGTFYSINTRCK